VVRAGLLIADRVFDVASLLERRDYVTTKGLLDNWELAHRELAAAASEISRDPRAHASTALIGVSLTAPIPEPGDVFCAGANYDDHIVEMFKIMNQPVGPNMKELGDLPWHFVKTGRSSVVGPDAEVALPRYSKAVDWELELAVVIGREAKNVTVERALEYVAGYTIANDLSARDVIQREKVAPTSPFRYDWISIKCFDGSCPLGPWMVPADAIADPQRLAMKLWVNEEIMQDSSTSKMIFSVAEQIAMLSSRLTLRPGDIVLTGTPAGVGMARRRFLKSGDAVTLWIEGIGTLRHRMV
jgi:2-keto-4-pentenoate hydratase/2-oxohepta-3-ene-1,7-dioic acid hydratase in catechol pathway